MYYKFIPAIFACTLLSAASLHPVAAAETQYDMLQRRLLAGTPTTSIIHLDQCKKNGEESKVPKATSGGTRIQDFMILPAPNAYIAYANSHFTVRPDGTPVLEFLKYRINKDDSAEITIQSLDPLTYKALSKPAIYKCTLGKGLEFKP